MSSSKFGKIDNSVCFYTYREDVRTKFNRMQKAFCIQQRICSGYSYAVYPDRTPEAAVQ